MRYKPLTYIRMALIWRGGELYFLNQLRTVKNNLAREALFTYCDLLSSWFQYVQIHFWLGFNSTDLQP